MYEFGKRLCESAFMRFLFVGGSATALQMLILFLLVEFLNLKVVLASSFGYAISSVYNYLLNYYLTFGSKQSHYQTFPKFVLVACAGVLCNAGAIAVFLATGMYYLVAQIGATIVTLIFNFLMHKYWIYRS